MTGGKLLVGGWKEYPLLPCGCWCFMVMVLVRILIIVV